MKEDALIDLIEELVNWAFAAYYRWQRLRQVLARRRRILLSTRY